jgi:hypothetical protein
VRSDGQAARSLGREDTGGSARKGRCVDEVESKGSAERVIGGGRTADRACTTAGKGMQRKRELMNVKRFALTESNSVRGEA